MSISCVRVNFASLVLIPLNCTLFIKPLHCDQFILKTKIRIFQTLCYWVSVANFWHCSIYENLFCYVYIRIYISTWMSKKGNFFASDADMSFNRSGSLLISTCVQELVRVFPKVKHFFGHENVYYPWTDRQTNRLA